MKDFAFTKLLPTGPSDTPYRQLTADGVRTFDAGGRTFLEIEPTALTELSYQAMHDIAHLLRPGHLAQLAKILDDPEASPNDKFVAYDLLKNANIAASGVLPMCQDTGTAIVMGKRGERAPPARYPVTRPPADAWSRRPIPAARPFPANADPGC